MCCVIWTRRQKTGPGPSIRMQPLRRSHLWRKEDPPNTSMSRYFWYSKSEQMWWYPKKVLPPTKLCGHSTRGWTQPPGTSRWSSLLMLQLVVASIYSNYIMLQLSYMGLEKIISSLLRSAIRGKAYNVALFANRHFVSTLYMSKGLRICKGAPFNWITAFKGSRVSPQHT